MDSVLSGLYTVEAGSRGNLIFGSVLKRLRLEQLMTPEQLAGRSGVSTPFVNGIERGAQAPSMETAKKLLDIVGNGNVTITWVKNKPYDLVLRDSKGGFEVQLVFKAEIRGQNRRPDRESGMDGIKSWDEGPLVDSYCPNENCSEHMIAVRYPATMEYINHLGAVYAYFDLPMRCSTCGSLYPPANEGQLETQTTGQEKIDPVVAFMDAHVSRMRKESGTALTRDAREIYANQDDCLIALSDGIRVDEKKLRLLPPWRAVFIARIALKVGCISEEQVSKLIEDARTVGGDGILPNV